jgi:hypothetical protein
MSVVIDLFGRLPRAKPPPQQPLTNFTPQPCPICKRPIADVAVDGRTAIRIRCPHSNCHQVVTLTRTSYLGHTGITRQKRA